MKPLRELIEEEIKRLENIDIQFVDQSDNSPAVYRNGIVKGLKMVLGLLKAREAAEQNKADDWPDPPKSHAEEIDEALKDREDKEDEA